MTRKDYIRIAEAIQSARYTCSQAGTETANKACNVVAFEFARLLAADNPRFDRERFLTACGVE